MRTVKFAIIGAGLMGSEFASSAAALKSHHNQSTETV